MIPFATILYLSLVSTAAQAQSQQPADVSPSNPTTQAAEPTDEQKENRLKALPKLPPLPKGKPTVIGGFVRDLDPVRDEFTLKVFGGQQLKVLFDARTEAYRNGKKVPLSSLRSGERASVETTLDGTKVFARSVHTLSESPEGQCRGQVVRTDPKAGTLVMQCDLTGTPVVLRVPSGTPIVDVNQDVNQNVNQQGSRSARSSTGAGVDLATGTLINAQFISSGPKQVTATRLSILARPGSIYKFSGEIVAVDTREKHFTVQTATNDTRYDIRFDSDRFPQAKRLRAGQQVSVSASFDGKNYTATALTGK